MKLSEFSFTLPEELIAQEPLQDRTQSRLLVVDKKQKENIHSHVADLRTFLRPGDLLVLNDSKVIPARLYGKKPTGGKIELLLVSTLSTTPSESVWEAMIGGHGVRPGMTLTLFPEDEHITCTAVERMNERTWKVRFDGFEEDFLEILNRIGSTPIPPYIHSTLSEKELRSRYQTVFAKDAGSVAAPTAGLHFTPELLSDLRAYGVQTTTVTLHVGLGTFSPIHEQDLDKHVMHKELASISEESAQIINRAKEEGRRVIAVGTTSVRTLESLAKNNRVEAGSKWTDIFIQPGYQFQIIDGMLTNFHLPESTLLVLVSALAGRERILAAYQEAIQNKYRFYSFGDAMLLV